MTQIPLFHRFAEAHKKLFTFSLDLGIDLSGIRASASEKIIEVASVKLETGGSEPDSQALASTTTIVRNSNLSRRIDSLISFTMTFCDQFFDGKHYNEVPIWQRSVLKAGNALKGPSIIIEVRIHPKIPAHSAHSYI